MPVAADHLSNLLCDLFDEGEEIRLELGDGSEFISADVDVVVQACMDDPDAWIDLVNQHGEAHGLSIPGDPTVVDPAPTVVTDGGMLFLLDIGQVIEGESHGKHMLSLSMIPDINTDAFYTLDELQITTPAREMDIILSQGRNRQEYQGKWKPVKSVFGQFSDALMTHTEGKKDGACFLQGECVSGVRKAAAMSSNYIIGVDLDSGAPLEDVMDSIIDAGLEAVIYTTHSHLKAESQIKRDNFLKWSDGEQPTPELCAEYLQKKKGVIPAITKNVEILNDSLHTEEGIVILVKHEPMPKFRAVFPLSEPFVFSRRGGTQQDAIAEWKERYAGFASDMKFFFDETCVDPARLFYLPRHKKGDTFGSWWVVGKPVDLDKHDRVKIRRDRNGQKRAVASNPFTDAAGGLDDDNDPNRYMVGDFNLLAWAKKNAKQFEVENFLSDVAPPDVIREPRSGGKGVHVECPFEAEHSTFGGGGTFVVNSSDAYDTGFDSGFGFKCVHAACQGRDRLDMIKGAIEEGWFEAGDLEDKRYLLELEEEEEDVVKPVPLKAAERTLSVPVIDRSHLPEEERKLHEMNDRYGVVINGEKVRILREPSPGKAVRPGRAASDVVFLTQTDAQLYEKNNMIVTTGKKGTEMQETMKAWLSWEGRRSYEEVTFAPGQDIDPDTYNLFRGFPVQPVEGDWSILRNHLFEHICESKEDLFDWVMTWMSHIFQHPEKKPGSALVIKGEKGAGKSTLFDYLRKLGGYHGIKISQRKHLLSNFNAHLTTAIIMVCEEAFWAADPSAEGVIKDLVTGETVMIEKKGYDAFEVPNYTRFAMVSNLDWVVPATMDERRWAVLQCASTMIGKLEYFEALRRQMDHEGGLQAMMYELLHYQPKHELGFNCLYTPPITIHLQAQQMESLPAIEKFMVEFVERGGYDAVNPNHESIELSEDKETIVYSTDLARCMGEYMQSKFQGDKAHTDKTYIAKIVKKWFGVGEVRVKRQDGKYAVLAFRMPSLKDARRMIEEQFGHKIETIPIDR